MSTTPSDGSRPTEDPTTADGSTPADDWQRRRRLAEIFGDVLPQTTSDERDDETPRASERESASDAWLRSQVPPHHGG